MILTPQDRDLLERLANDRCLPGGSLGECLNCRHRPGLAAVISNQALLSLDPEIAIKMLLEIGRHLASIVNAAGPGDVPGSSLVSLLASATADVARELV